MTDDNSPQLGGQDHDNAPMISGRGTKIIVSARGAYLARNRIALINQMEPNQWLLYRQAVIIELLGRLRPQLEQLAQTGRDVLYDVLRDMDQWLAHPSEPTAEQLRQYYENDVLEQINLPERFLHFLLYGVIHDDADSPHHVISYVLLHRYHAPTQGHGRALWSELENWQVELAWLILQHNRIPSPLPPLHIDPTSLDAAVADAERWYRRKDLILLVYLMNEAQRQRLRQTILGQAFWLLDSVPAQQWNSSDREWIEMARQWLTHPESLSLEILRIASRNLFATKRSKYAYYAIEALFMGFDPILYSGYSEHTLQIAGYVARMKTPQMSEVEKEAARAAAYDWQMEAAWAILHHQPIPPFGDSDVGR